MKDLIHKCDLLLIRPPVTHRTFLISDPIRIDLPIGLLSLAGCLLNNNIDVCIYDSYADVDIERLIAIYNKQKEDYVIGSTYEQIIDKIAKADPYMIGITCMYNKNIKETIELSIMVKSIFPDKVIVVGGAAATSLRQELIDFADNCIDIICLGEGESTLLSIIDYHHGKQKLSEIHNIVFKNDQGQYIENPRGERIRDLDTIPFPAYDKIDMEHYFALRNLGFIPRFTYDYPNIHRGLVLFTSRGCPFKCIFCGNHLHMGRGIRYFSIDYIVEHIKYLNNKYGVTHFHIEDDNLNCNQTRFEKLVDEIIKLPFNITWDACNGMRGDLLANDGLLIKIKMSGCNFLIMAVESGDQEIVNKVVKKNIDLRKTTETARLCQKLKIDLHAFYIIGFVGENLTNIQNTMDYAKYLMEEYDVFPHIFIADPLKGTELFEIAEKNNYLVRNDNWRHPFVIETPEFNNAILRDNYINPANNYAKLLIFKKIIGNSKMSSLLSNLLYFYNVLKNLGFVSLKELIYKTIMSKAVFINTNNLYSSKKARD